MFRSIKTPNLRELPKLVDRLVMQPKAGLDTIGIVGGLHVLDLRTLLVAETVTMQVVNVCHVNGVLKDTPVVAVKLDLTCRTGQYIRLVPKRSNKSKGGRVVC